MKHIFFILFLFPIVLFSQTIDIRKSEGLTTEENCFLALGAQQNAINANTVIELRDDVAGVSVNNGITYDNVTFRATLKANKTYKLTASIKHLGSVSNTAATYRWYDVTNSTFIGRENQVQSMNSLGNEGDQPFVAAIITPTTDIEVELRCQTISAANQSMNAFATYAIIEKISELSFSPSGLTSPGTTIEFTSTFDNTLITKLSGAGTIVYDVSNPSTGQIAINGGTVTKVGKLLAYQFHVISDQDAEFVLIMDISLIPGEIVSMSVVADDGSLHQLGLRSPGARQIRFNRDDAINADLDYHLLVWVDGGTEIAVIPVGTFTGTAGSIPFSNGTSIVEDNANLFYDDGNNRWGIGTNTPTEIVHLQKSGQDNYLKIDAGGITSNFSGLMLTENNINFGWTLRHDANTDNLFISIQDNTPTFTNLVTYKRDGKIDAPKNHQVFTATINGSGTWQTVNYPTSFPSGSAVRVFATPQDDNDNDYFVRVRSVGLTSFQFIPTDHNGRVHTGASVIGFWAIRQN